MHSALDRARKVVEIAGMAEESPLGDLLSSDGLRP